MQFVENVNRKFCIWPVPKPLMTAENIVSVRTAAPEGPVSPPWTSVELEVHSGILTLIFLKQNSEKQKNNPQKPECPQTRFVWDSSSILKKTSRQPVQKKLPQTPKQLQQQKKKTKTPDLQINKTKKIPTTFSAASLQNRN